MAGAVEALLDSEMCEGPVDPVSEPERDVGNEPAVPLDIDEAADVRPVLDSIDDPPLVERDDPLEVAGLAVAPLELWAFEEADEEVAAAAAVVEVLAVVDLPAVVVDEEYLNSVMYPYPPQGCPDAPEHA